MTSRLISLGSKALAIGGTGVCATALYRYQSVLKEESNSPTNELYSFSHQHPANKKQCIIIGGGVVGVTAAYKLALKGHKVVLLEPNSAPGKEVSSLSCVCVDDTLELVQLIHLAIAHTTFSVLHIIFSAPLVLLVECKGQIQLLIKERG